MKHNFFKKIFTLLFLMCSTAAIANNFEVDGIYYKITDATNKTVAVTYNGFSFSSTNLLLLSKYSGSVAIPESVTYDGNIYSVTSIGDDAFSTCDSLTNVIIPNSVTSIGDDAFDGCSGLTSVVIPNSVTSILRCAFDGCSGLTSVVIPNTITSIEDYTFRDCSGLTSIEIPNSVTSIGDYAFDGCSGLTSVVIPNSVTSIGSSAFSGCSGLTSIEIPNSVTSIGYYALNVTAWYNNQPDGVVYAGKVLYEYKGTMPSNTSITIKEGTLCIGDYVFRDCTGLTSIEIPNSVTSIGDYAFDGCSGLTNIVIPNGVTSIGDYAFDGCSGLTNVVIGNSVTNIGTSAFSGCTKLVKVYISDLAAWCGIDFGSTDANPLFYAKNLYLNDMIATNLVIPDNVTSIGNYAFYNCSGLTSVVIGNSVTSIGSSAFYDCTGLTNVVIPNSVTSIANNAFDGTAWYNNQSDGVVYAGKVLYEYKGTMPSNTSITIKEGTLCIGDYVFRDCTGLTNVVIPNSVTSIGGSAFSGCTGLTNIVIPNSVTSIGGSAFYGCTGLTSVEIPNSVTSIGGSAFYGCTSLKELRIEDGTEILELEYFRTGGIFNDCPLETLYLGRNFSHIIYNITLYNNIEKNVNNVNNPHFQDMKTLTSVTIGDCVTSIDASTFSGCSGLTSVVIPNCVTSIGDYAFDGCSSLTNVIIPNTITSIEDYTFRGCSGLTSVVIPNSVTNIGKNAFYGCKSLISITIGNGITTIGSNAFSECAGLEKIYMLSRIAKVYDGNIFSETTYNNAKLYVPEGRGFAYSKTAPWSNFYIEELKNSYNVTYKIGEEVYATYSIECFSEIPLPDTPQKEGHTFSGWSNIPATMPAEDITITGSFSVNSYNVTFVVDGEVYHTVSVNYGEAITLPQEPTKIGHTFSGWEGLSATMPAEDITVTALFGVNSYNVTFVIDGEVYQTVSVNYGEAIALHEEPTKEGHTFSGWSNIPATMPAEDITVTGSFSVNSYNVTFVVEGEVYHTVSVNYGEAITLPEKPTKEGHTFNGWEGLPATMLACDITVVASFVVNSYNLIYMIDGEVYYTTLIEYGATIQEIETPYKEGHTFSGWNSVIPEVMPANDVVINGSFTVNSYMVFFIVDEAVYHMSTVKYNEEIELPSSPVKDGYIFSHWDGLPEVMPAENVVVWAVFDVDTAINELKGESGKVKTIYDLNGRKVVNPQKGLYIIDGEKVFIK